MKKILIISMVLGSFFNLFALNTIELKTSNISMGKNSFKLLEFKKMIEAIKVSDKKSVEVSFVEDENKPLQKIKLFSKEIGHSNILISFFDKSKVSLNINVSANLDSLILIAKELSPKLEIKQINKKLILKGQVKNKKAKDKILDLFKKAGVNLEEDLVDLSTLENPNKMIRVKLYAVEINNDKGKDLKNNWFVSSKNYMEVINPDKTYQNQPLDSSNNNEWNNANNQRNKEVNDSINRLMSNAVSLTGGLTGAANYLGRNFNAGFTLNYLSSKGVANVLDETTLLTLENKDATFHAGGTIYTKMQTTTDKGVPTTELKEIDYGLKLNIKAKNIINEDFINLEIVTKSTGIDWSNQVDGIPSFTQKSIVTNVVAKNSSTIVLGGLINRKDSKDIKKIPFLGDIPILGFLFTSKSFQEGKSELVFFITPEVVDARDNNQEKFLAKKTVFAKKIDKRIKKDKEEEIKKAKEELEKKRKAALKKKKEKKEDLSSLEEHQKRVNQILGLN